MATKDIHGYPWRIRIQIGGVTHTLCYQTIEEAQIIRDTWVEFMKSNPNAFWIGSPPNYPNISIRLDLIQCIKIEPNDTPKEDELTELQKDYLKTTKKFIDREIGDESWKGSD